MRLHAWVLILHLTSDLDNFYYRCVIACILYFRHWVNEKVERGRKKKCKLWLALFNINHYVYIVYRFIQEYEEGVWGHPFP